MPTGTDMSVSLVRTDRSGVHKASPVHVHRTRIGMDTPVWSATLERYGIPRQIAVAAPIISSGTASTASLVMVGDRGAHPSIVVPVLVAKTGTELLVSAAVPDRTGTDIVASLVLLDKFGTLHRELASVLPDSNGMELPVSLPVPQAWST